MPFVLGWTERSRKRDLERRYSVGSGKKVRNWLVSSELRQVIEIDDFSKRTRKLLKTGLLLTIGRGVIRKVRDVGRGAAAAVK